MSNAYDFGAKALAAATRNEPNASAKQPRNARNATGVILIGLAMSSAGGAGREGEIAR